jgi:hypothetical protein
LTRELKEGIFISTLPLAGSPLSLVALPSICIVSPGFAKKESVVSFTSNFLDILKNIISNENNKYLDIIYEELFD